MTTTDRIRALAAASVAASEGAEQDWPKAAYFEDVTALMPESCAHAAHHSPDWTARNAKLLEALAFAYDELLLARRYCDAAQAQCEESHTGIAVDVAKGQLAIGIAIDTIETALEGDK